MKVFTVFGTSGSGKTTTIERLARELRRRGYSVGSVKEIHFEQFALDTPGSNTDRHRQAGADPVTARGMRETDIMFGWRLSIEQILRFYGQDFVILEGVRESGIPAILTAGTREEIAGQMTPFVFAVAGRAAPEMDAETLADLVERKVYARLPGNSAECCGLCGFDCEEQGRRMLAGGPGGCLLEKRVTLKINGRELEMVPFVQAILKNAVLGVAKELRGYEKGKVEVSFSDE